MRIVALSDTHLFTKFPLPPGDVLVHAGDLTWWGNFQEIVKAAAWLKGLPYRHKIVVAGNHDFLFQRELNLARGLLGSEIIYLQDSGISIEGITFYGSPWQPEFMEWAFNLPRGAPLREVWSKIPETLDVLITHGPPLGYGDLTQSGERAGCEELRARLEDIKVRYHIFGHIHEGYGAYPLKETHLFNVSICDVNNLPTNAPLVIDL